MQDSSRRVYAYMITKKGGRACKLASSNSVRKIQWQHMHSPGLLEPQRHECTSACNLCQSHGTGSDKTSSDLSIHMINNTSVVGGEHRPLGYKKEGCFPCGR